ncbi:hypothetical protein GYMLUDRAFT_252352 [Collybiopsis luxurians FD-317 M1]|uniref:Uncharacterized protein n=1 Tax=Collybiopsis luxurians FD-317 M1 TaxID=944289 RepID=A0A0D0BA25_9AGAR|nr:hypothetical protein GYMLUDRAFT_252352 [Collybiopsis luxurians FD-317 M1]
MEGINNIDVVEVILDLQTTLPALMYPSNALNNGRSGWGQSLPSYKTEMAHTENFTASTWALLHHARIFTNAHQDSEGYNVAIQVTGNRSDPSPKIWGVLKFKDPEMPKKTQMEIAELVADVCGLQSSSDVDKFNEHNLYQLEDPHWSEFCTVDLIYVLPGDLV